MNCRLPQTPRTPASAAAHYFDDVFSRQRRASLGARRPTGLARSRSIGARSDWAASQANSRRASTAGDDEAEDRSIAERADVNDANGDDGDDDPKGKGGPSRTWSIYKEDGDGNGKGVHSANGNGSALHEDPDDPINKFVQDQLQRLKSHESNELTDEIAAQADGVNDEREL
jgi:hypothetical protein